MDRPIFRESESFFRLYLFSVRISIPFVLLWFSYLFHTIHFFRVLPSVLLLRGGGVFESLLPVFSSLSKVLIPQILASLKLFPLCLRILCTCRFPPFFRYFFSSLSIVVPVLSHYNVSSSLKGPSLRAMSYYTIIYKYWKNSHE